jgi:tetratricopeptide (TPR) repeat protein
MLNSLRDKQGFLRLLLEMANMRVSLLGLVLGLCSNAHAQTEQPDSMSAAFARMMARPDNADAALEYARVAASRGETRAAIAALERVLRANPKLDNIRLELASLYLAAGSPDVAAVYAREALASPQIPPAVAVRAKQLLTSAEKASARSLFQTSIFVGPRWDSNATAATAAATVSAFAPSLGAVVSISPPVRAEPDWSIAFSGTLYHRYDLGLQREGAWETNLSTFGQYFATINPNYDLTILQFDTGPRIGVGEIGETLISVRPFFSTNYIAYGSYTYTTLYGGGLSAQARPLQALTVELTGIGRFGNYQNSPFRPLSRQYTGPEWSISANNTYAVNSNISVSVGLFYYGADAQQTYYNRSGPGGSVSVFAETAIAGYPIGVAARTGLRRLLYGGPDPFLNPTQTRDDVIFEAGLSLIVPVYHRLKAVAQYAFYRDNSTYQLYTYTDHSVSVGLRLDF